MIQNDFIEHTEFRTGFFKLVHNVINFCANGLFALAADKFQNLILVVIFAMQHEKPELMEIGLESMYSLTSMLSQQPSYAGVFYQSFFTQIITETISVMTDYRHVQGFKLQGMILCNLLSAVINPALIGSN